MNRTPRATSYKLLVLIAAVSLVAAACGNESDTTTATTTTAAPATTTTAAAETAEPTTTAAGGTTETTAPAETTEPPQPSSPEDILATLAFDIGGRGDGTFNDAAAKGLDQAENDLGVSTQEISPNSDGSNRAEILQISADQGADIVIGVGFLFGEVIHNAAQQNPDTFFGVVDDAGRGPNFDTPLENLAGLTFAEHEGSFLVGVAAALKSKTEYVGFIGGVDIPLIRKFYAGFYAGVQAANQATNRAVSIFSQYITEPPDFSGWSQPAEAKIIAQSLYEDEGVDVIYHAAGGSGAGLFEAAKEFSESEGTKVWAIGVDSDQYNTADESVREYILTSMLKRVDVAVYNTIEAVANGEFEGDTQVFDLKVDGVGYSTSGGFIDDIVPQLEEFKQAIIDGEIEVPDTVEELN